MSEDNPPEIKRAKLCHEGVTKSVHTFSLELPLHTENDYLKFIKESKIRFSFSDGNFTGVKNLFAFSMSHGSGSIRSFAYQIVGVPEEDNLQIFGQISASNSSGVVQSSDFVFREIENAKHQKIGLAPLPSFKFSNDCSEIKVTMNVVKLSKGTKAIVENLPSNSTVPIKKVNESFSQYFLSEELSDCKVVAGEKVFPVHRFVLADISEFCKKMFSISMTENQDRVWNIEDFDPAVVEEFLEFAYKGTSENLNLKLAKDADAEILKELFRIAHKYDVVLLKVKCEGLLNSLINDENVLNLYHLGFLYESESLKAAAKIHFNRFKHVILPNKDAFFELCKNYSNDMIYELTIK